MAGYYIELYSDIKWITNGTTGTVETLDCTVYSESRQLLPNIFHHMVSSTSTQFLGLTLFHYFTRSHRGADN